MDLKTGKGSVKEGGSEGKADCIITVEEKVGESQRLCAPHVLLTHAPCPGLPRNDEGQHHEPKTFYAG